MQIDSTLARFSHKFRRLIGLVLIPMFLSIAGFLSLDLSQQEKKQILNSYYGTGELVYFDADL